MCRRLPGRLLHPGVRGQVCPASSPRPPNRACGFPAHDSPTPSPSAFGLAPAPGFPWPGTAYARKTPTWQFVISPAVPVHCRCTPADRRPDLQKPVSSAISTPAGSPSPAATVPDQPVPHGPGVPDRGVQPPPHPHRRAVTGRTP